MEDNGTQNETQDALDEARREIDEVDRQMAALFARRMAAAAHIATYKAQRGLPVRDPSREEALLARNAALVDETIRPHYLHFMEAMLEESRSYQHRLMENSPDEISKG